MLVHGHFYVQLCLYVLVEEGVAIKWDQPISVWKLFFKISPGDHLECFHTSIVMRILYSFHFSIFECFRGPEWLIP